MKARERLVGKLLHGSMPVPGPVRPAIRLLYVAGVYLAEILRCIYGGLIAGPVMKSIASVGTGLRIERIPYIRGKGRIRLGSNIYISGKIGIAFSRHAHEPPELTIGDNAFIGHECAFSLARGISIGSNCLIGTGVRIQDNDGHSLDADKRRSGQPVGPSEVKPVSIGDNVWIAPRAIVLKGVTIGENAVIGTGSIVTRDVPADAVVAGVPAKAIRQSP